MASRTVHKDGVMRYKATAQGNVPFTVEENAARDAEESAWEAGRLDRLSQEAREKRNKQISLCDWVVIPQQVGFPENIVWPVPPS
jgi:hypothetical protein